MLGPPVDYGASILQGTQEGQALGATQALKGVDLNNPDQVDQTINGLAQHGAIEQGSALSNLALTRSIIKQEPGLMAALNKSFTGGDSDQSQAAPPAPPPPPSAASPTPGDFNFNPQRAGAIMTDAAQAADRLAALPDLASRYKAFYGDGQGDPGIKGYFLAHGVPEQALDAVATHLADPNALQGLSAHYKDAINHFGSMAANPSTGALPSASGTGGGISDPTQTGPGSAELALTAPKMGAATVPPEQPFAPPPGENDGGAPSGSGDGSGAPPTPQTAVAAAKTLAMHPTTQSWAYNFLSGPNGPMAMALLKRAGIDMTPVLEAAKTVAGPQYQQAAEAEYALPKETAKQTAETAFAGPKAAATAMGTAQGTMGSYTLADGSKVDLPVSTALAMSKLNPAMFKGPGIAAAAAAQAAGTEGVTEQYKPVSVKSGGGDLTMTGAQFAQQGNKGAVYTSNPAQERTLSVQGENAGKLLTPDDKSVTDAAALRQTGQRAIQAIDTLGKIDNATGTKVKVAGIMRTLGMGGPGVDNYAQGGMTFQQLATQLRTQAARTDFPGGRVTNADLHAEEMGGINNFQPEDQAKAYIAQKVALAQRKSDFAKFASDYQGDKSDPQAIMRAWYAGPGSRSLYSDPLWKNVQLGGQPAVRPFTYQGHQMLRIGDGTKHGYNVLAYDGPPQ